MEERRLGRVGPVLSGTAAAAVERERARRIGQMLGGLGVVWILWLVFGVKPAPIPPKDPPRVVTLAPPAGAPRMDQIHGMHLVYELSGNTDANEIVVLFHGCHHSATDWWPRSEQCPPCIGLPHEQRIVSWLLHGSDRSSRVAAVLAISSSDRQGSKCWNSTVSSAESAQGDATVPRVLITWLQENLPHLSSPTWTLFGASSGGSFASALPHFLTAATAATAAVAADAVALPGAVAGIISQVATPRSVEDIAGLPPLVLIPARRDDSMRIHAQKLVEQAKAAESEVALVVMEPLQIDSDFFARRVGMDPVESSALVAAMVASGLISAETRLLVRDPRRCTDEWRAAVNSSAMEYLARGQDKLEADESPLYEELNAAYALHEISSDSFIQGISALDAMNDETSHEKSLNMGA